MNLVYNLDEQANDQQVLTEDLASVVEACLDGHVVEVRDAMHVFRQYLTALQENPEPDQKHRNGFLPHMELLECFGVDVGQQEKDARGGLHQYQRRNQQQRHQKAAAVYQNAIE